MGRKSHAVSNSIMASRGKANWVSPTKVESKEKGMKKNKA
jgi:hypothetical protein